jgi:hypothetical protein
VLEAALDRLRRIPAADRESGRHPVSEGMRP